ncbi:hypothetical protein [Brevibacillus invocatus]|uniref:hypothetical protein n=1 Tax=Brevibacillus invocatus TaxID=173959 RepID=UPI00203BA6BC|nr:hypothetical protein [Brevibacillus invocatus]MCM3081926.1 hypothetical protein [Brevibacillus invocatus]MCM3432332.1 hypothetical protein [Brevibacillus invocatus]
MTKNNHPITINFHFHQVIDTEKSERGNTFSGLSKYENVNCTQKYEDEDVLDLCEYDDLDDIDVERFDIEISEDARTEVQSHKEHFLGNELEVCFTDYKGIPLIDFSKEIAAKLIQEIGDALRQLPVPPDHIDECEDVLFAAWNVPYERRCLLLNDDEFTTMMNNFKATVGSIGISTPWMCECFLNDQPWDSGERQVHHYYENRHAVLDFDQMCGLRITAIDQSITSAKSATKSELDIQKL